MRAWRHRLRRHVALVGLLLGVGVLIAPPQAARADGDPASDVLVAAPPLFLSADSGASYVQKAAIVDQLQAAARRGRRLRVAVISHRVDLGSVTALWGAPESYAEFLGRELSLEYRGELLVVMPSGFGLSRDGRPVHTSLDRLAPRHGELLTATEQAVAHLTGATVGHLRIPTTAAAPSRTAGVGWWTATTLAVAAVVAAWVASLRARPWRTHRPLGHGH